jgi:hypothetical protein
VYQFSQIERHVQRGGTGIGEDITGILVGDILPLVVAVKAFDYAHVASELSSVDRGGGYILEPFFGTIPLATLGKGTMPMSHQLMGAGPGDTFNLEGEVDMLKHTMMATCVKVLHQGHRVLGITVIADGGNLSDGLHRIGCCLYECYVH